MSVLVDTPVWSLGLRRQRRQLSPLQRRTHRAWHELVRIGEAELIGPIRQEILSGIREADLFERIRGQLAPFDERVLEPSDYEQAARHYNRCRSRGIAGSPVDMLICSVAERYDLPILTTDADFPRYAQHLPIRLYDLRTARP